jgi:hypothetical protein
LTANGKLKVFALFTVREQHIELKNKNSNSETIAQTINNNFMPINI